MEKEQTTGQIVILGEDNSGRDEMNLAGNPFALLQASSKNDQLFIRYQWERQLSTGKRVIASWEVQGGGRLGLPGPAEELLYLVLMQLTREATAPGQDWPEIIHFSRVDILQRMGWSRTPKFYSTLRDAFARLQAVSIQADYAFWNAQAKVPYESIGFAIIDDYAITAEPVGRKSIQHISLPLSWFRWNKTLHTSFLSGNVRSLALDFAVSLEYPTSRRLFRLLDMMRNAQTPPRREFAMGLFKLRDRLGMSNYKFPSKIKEKLVSAHEELRHRGYLEHISYSNTKDGSPLVIYRFTDGRQNCCSNLQEETRQSMRGTSEWNISHSKNAKAPILSVHKDVSFQNNPKKLAIKDRVGQSAGKTLFDKETLETDKNKSSGGEFCSEHIDVRTKALICYHIYKALSTEEQTELRETARRHVEPAFWDRLEVPESPMSLQLWSLVARRYPEKLGDD